MLKTPPREMTAEQPISERSIARIYRGAADLILNPEDACVFPPTDPWTMALAEALVRESEAGNFDGKKIMELGVGSGVNMLGLKALALNNFFRQPPSFMGLDITMESVKACDQLAAMHGFRDEITLYESNLLNDVPPEALEGVDVVFACLPQVRWDYEVMQREPEAREFADYYIVPTEEVPEDAYALGLLARALDQIREKMPQASVLFNVAGRQGDKSFQLFSDRFDIVRPVVERIIPHDRGTSLTSFIKWEEMSGESCRFYRDPEGEQEIDAAEAEDRREAGAPLYHDLFVMKAEM